MISIKEIEQEAEKRYPEYPDDGETTHHDPSFEGKQDAFYMGAMWAIEQNNINSVEPTEKEIEMPVKYVVCDYSYKDGTGVNLILQPFNPDSAKSGIINSKT